MPRVETTVTACQCRRCNHVWVPRIKARAPRICPSCKREDWDGPIDFDQQEGENSEQQPEA